MFSSFRIPGSETSELECEGRGYLVTVPFSGRRRSQEQHGASRLVRTLRACHEVGLGHEDEGWLQAVGVSCGHWKAGVKPVSWTVTYDATVGKSVSREHGCVTWQNGHFSCVFR